VLGLVLVFLAVRFPYERLLPAALAAARAATGAEVVASDLGLGLGLGGPHLRARDVRARWPGAQELAFDTVRLRPAWSPSWLAGRPAWHVAAEGAAGAWQGTLGIDRLAGAWRDVESDALPWILLGSLAPLHGRVSGELDLARSDGAWRGSARLSGADGSVDLPGLPVAIPFVALEAALAVAPEQVTLASGRLEGPLVTARAGGTLAAAGGAFATWPIDLQVEIESIDPALRGYLGPLGIPVAADGRAQVRIGGTLAAPFLSRAAP
jgi:type II secretion system protein N